MSDSDREPYDMRMFVSVFHVYPEVSGMPTHDTTVPVMVVNFPKMTPLTCGQMSFVYADANELTFIPAARGFLKRSILTGSITDGLALVALAKAHGFKVVSPGSGAVRVIPFVSADTTHSNRPAVVTCQIDAETAYGVHTSGPTEKEFQAAVGRVRQRVVNELMNRYRQLGVNDAIFAGLDV